MQPSPKPNPQAEEYPDEKKGEDKGEKSQDNGNVLAISEEPNDAPSDGAESLDRLADFFCKRADNSQTPRTLSEPKGKLTNESNGALSILQALDRDGRQQIRQSRFESLHSPGIDRLTRTKSREAKAK